jgi:TfoX N-terminal domain
MRGAAGQALWRTDPPRSAAGRASISDRCVTQRKSQRSRSLRAVHATSLPGTLQSIARRRPGHLAQASLDCRPITTLSPQLAGDALANVRLADMAYDTELADRIRFLIGTRPGVTEKKMFGGLAFLVGGNMAISASGQGGALVRADPAETGALVTTANATLAVMGGRTMQGWLRVSSEDLETDEQLTEWVNRAVGYARSLPPKR